MIFVDTSAWYAAYVPKDRYNQAVLRVLQNTNDKILTSDFVIDETITLLQARGDGNARSHLVMTFY